MTTEHRKGDLFQSTDLQAICHGCNTFGTMGAGIAVLFRKKFPEMYTRYRSKCKNEEFSPGDIMIWSGESDGKAVYNLMTQGCVRNSSNTYNPGVIQPATLGAIEASVGLMLVDAKSRGITRIGMPKIGSGLGGLNWLDIENVLVKSCEEIYPGVTLVVHSLV